MLAFKPGFAGQLRSRSHRAVAGGRHRRQRAGLGLGGLRHVALARGRWRRRHRPRRRRHAFHRHGRPADARQHRLVRPAWWSRPIALGAAVRRRRADGSPRAATAPPTSSAARCCSPPRSCRCISPPWPPPAIVHDPTFRLLGAMSLSPESMGVALAAVVGSMLATCLIGSLSDRSTRRKIDAQNVRLDSALNNMNQGLCMFDADNKLVVWNQRYVDMYRIDPKRIWLGCTIRDLLDARIAAGTFPLDSARYDGELRAALKQGKSFTLTTELADGRIIAVVNQPSPDGGWVATHEDITEQKRAERELEHTRAFLDTIIENVPSPIMVKAAPRPATTSTSTAPPRPIWASSRDDHAGQDRPRHHAAKPARGRSTPRTARCSPPASPSSPTSTPSLTPGNGTRITTETRLACRGPDGSRNTHRRGERPHRAQAQRAAHRPPGASRHAHRPAQPRRLQRMHRRHHRSRRGRQRKLRRAVDRHRPLQGGQRRVRPLRRRRAAARGRPAHGDGLRGRLPGAHRRRRIRRHLAVRSAAGDRRGARRAPAGGARARYRDRRPRAQGRASPSASRSIRRTAPTPPLWSPTPTPRSTAPRRRRAARCASSTSRWTSSCATSARCSRTWLSAIARDELTLHYQPQARIDGDDHRLRGAGALAASAPRHGAALDLHSAGRGKRHHRRARRMGAARRLPRGGELAEAAHRRHQSVAGAVPRRRPAQAGARGAAGDRACARRGSSSRSPRAC